jgi:hypothetical protein
MNIWDKLSKHVILSWFHFCLFSHVGVKLGTTKMFKFNYNFDGKIEYQLLKTKSLKQLDFFLQCRRTFLE